MVKKFNYLNKYAVPEVPVMVPIDTTTLTDKYRIEPNLFKERRDGSIKVRACADGIKHM